MNNFWANQKGRGPNNRSNRGSERNNQALSSHSSPEHHSMTPQSTPQGAPNNRSNRGSERITQSLYNHSSPGAHSGTHQDMPQRDSNNRSSQRNNQALNIQTSPLISSRTNPHRPQIHPRFTQGRYQDPNIVDARTTQPPRVPFASSAINNATSLMALRYGNVLPIDLPIGNITNLNSFTTQGNLFSRDDIHNSFNGFVDYAPDGFSNYSRPNFVTNNRSNRGSEPNNQALSSHSSPEHHSMTPQSMPHGAPNNRSNRGSERINQSLYNHSSPGAHSRTPQGMPQRAPNNRSSRGRECNNQPISSHPSPGGHSGTHQDMPQRDSNNRSSQRNNQALNSQTSPPISSRTNPHRPQIHPRFTQGRYQDPNIVDARTTEPSRVSFATSTINNAAPLIAALRYGHAFPIDLPIGNITNLNSPATQGNLFNHNDICNSFIGGVDYAPYGFSNYSRPNFLTNVSPYSSRPNFATSGFPNSFRPNFHHNQRNIFSYGESSNNSSMINNFNNPRTRLNMNNFYNQRSLPSFEENFNNSSLLSNDNFMINPSTSVNMNDNFHTLESNPIMPSPPPRTEINDLELVRNPSTNNVDLACERALKRPLVDVDQETEGFKRSRRTNDFCEGQPSEVKELLLFKDSDDGEKNTSSTSGTATNGDGNQNDEENLDLSLHL